MENLDKKPTQSKVSAPRNKRARASSKKKASPRKSKKNEISVLKVLNLIRARVDSTSFSPSELAQSALKWAEGSSRKVLSQFKK